MTCGCSDPAVFGHDACFTRADAGIPPVPRTVHSYCRCAACPCQCHKPREGR